MVEVPCSMCDKTFQTAADLERHMQAKHPQNVPAELVVESESVQPRSLRIITKEVLGIFFGRQKKQCVEREMLKLGLYTILGLLVLGGIAYRSFFSKVAGAGFHHVLLLVYLMIGTVTCFATLWHTRSYPNATHMTGMMVGMTIGMTMGFSVGLVLGATNGLFVGAILGLIAGVVAGAYAGKCCGIMGVLEGQMAGYMAGPMGAMTSLMMLNDHYKIFIPVALFVQVTILAGLMYIVYTENNGRSLDLAQRNARTGFWKFFLMNFLVWLALSFIIFFGPKSTFTIFTAN